MWWCQTLIYNFTAAFPFNQRKLFWTFPTSSCNMAHSKNMGQLEYGFSGLVFSLRGAPQPASPKWAMITAVSENLVHVWFDAMENMKKSKKSKNRVWGFSSLFCQSSTLCQLGMHPIKCIQRIEFFRYNLKLKCYEGLADGELKAR